MFYAQYAMRARNRTKNGNAMPQVKPTQAKQINQQSGSGSFPSKGSLMTSRNEANGLKRANLALVPNISGFHMMGLRKKANCRMLETI